MRWRDSLGVKDTSCSCRGPGFGSQDRHGSWQPSGSRVPTIQPLPLASGGMWYRHTYRQNTWAYNIGKKNHKMICSLGLSLGQTEELLQLLCSTKIICSSIQNEEIAVSTGEHLAFFRSASQIMVKSRCGKHINVMLPLLTSSIIGHVGWTCSPHERKWPMPLCLHTSVFPT